MSAPLPFFLVLLKLSPSSKPPIAPISSLPEFDFHSQGSLLGVSEDVKEQLSDAATHTVKAYAAVRRGRDPDAEVEPSRPLSSNSLFAADMHNSSGKTEVKTMSPEVLVMKPILRFLQLLCENHNRELQVGWRSD